MMSVIIFIGNGRFRSFLDISREKSAYTYTHYVRSELREETYFTTNNAIKNAARNHFTAFAPSTRLIHTSFQA